MKIYIITGGAGFIGSNFVRFLIKKEKKTKIIVYDSLEYSGLPFNLHPYLKEENIIVPLFGKDIYPYKKRKNIKYKKIKEKKELQREIEKFIKENDKVLLVVSSITDRDTLHVVLNFSDIVFNFAAETHVDRSIIYPHRFIFTDFVGTYFLLDVFREIHGDKGKFIHISTDEVYGEILKGKAKENSPFYPSSPYSASKAGADRLVYSFYKTYRIPTIIIRPSNVFGERQFPEKFIPLSIMRLLKGKKIPIYGDGKQKRNWIYQEDAVRGIYLIYKKGKIGEEYNLPGNVLIENIKVAEMLCEISGREKEEAIEFVKDRPAHDRRYAMDGEKVKIFGFEYKWDFKSALERTFKFYKENFDFYDNLLKEKETREFMKRWYEERKL